MRALVWILVWLMCLLVALWTMLAIPFSAAFGSGRRAWSVAVGYDQLGNAAAGGNEDETFSSRCWRNRERPHYALMVMLIDWVFLRLRGEEDHCMNAWLAEMAARKLPF